MGTWDSWPVRIDSVSLKIPGIIHTIDFILQLLYSDHELMNSVCDVRSIFLSKTHRLSTHEISSINSTISRILAIRVSRSARSRSINSSCSRSCSRVYCSYTVRVCPISIAWDSICLFNSRMLFSTRSALYSCLRISDFASASNRSFCLSRRILIWSPSNSWLESRLCDIQTTDFPVHKNWPCTWNQPLFIRVISLPQTRLCFLLLDDQWWSQRIPDVLVVNVSVRGLRAVVAKVKDWRDTRALEDRTVTSMSSKLSVTLGSSPVGGGIMVIEPQASFRGLGAVDFLIQQRHLRGKKWT